MIQRAAGYNPSHAVRYHVDAVHLVILVALHHFPMEPPSVLFDRLPDTGIRPVPHLITGRLEPPFEGQHHRGAGAQAMQQENDFVGLGGICGRWTNIVHEQILLFPIGVRNA